MSFTNDITEVTTFNFWQNFLKMIILNFEFSNYQTLIKAYINTPYKRNRIFSVFGKKNFKWKEKKPILSYPRLRYAHKKLNFACKKKVFFFRKMFVCVQNSICNWKKKPKKFLGQVCKITWKTFGSPSKNASHTISIYGNCMESIYFKKKCFKSVFCHQSVQLFSKSRRNGLIFFSVFRKCIKKVWQVFSPYTLCMDLYDNDFCCMELYDKYFRCMEVNPGSLLFFVHLFFPIIAVKYV